MNPLAAYLERTGTTQAAFAERLTRLGREKIWQQQVSAWAAVRVPSRGTRRLIARATRGEVPADSWTAVKKPKRRAA